ncbi:hypothetical protein V1511DRAFT_503867 [Dipodascopsis uninucleata]
MASSAQKYRVDLESLHSEMMLLQRRRAELSAKLEKLRTEKTLNQRLKESQNQSILDQVTKNDQERGRDILAHISSKYGVRKNIQTENLYRMAGITAFKINDPAFKGYGEELLGVRIEYFALGTFASPHYLIIARDEKTNDYFIYKHTIPLHIPLEKICKLYLNKDLKYFVRVVRKQLILDHQKRSYLSSLPYVEAIEADDSCELVKLEFDIPKYGIRHAYVYCDLTSIKKAVVLAKSIDLESEEDGQGEEQRDSKLEQIMLGNINQLYERFSSHLNSIAVS